MSTNETFEADRAAPVYAEGEIEVTAPAQVVWDVVANVDKWPSWNREISTVSLEGPIAEGTQFRWKAGRSKLASVFRRVDPPHVVGWTGKTLGIPAIHVWRIEPTEGGSILRTQESWSGLLAGLLKRKLQVMLEEALEKGLKATKAEAERRARER